MEFVGTFWSLLPPIVAIVLALITKETYLSLFVGIVVGALLLAGFDPITTINYIMVGETPDGAELGLIHAISDPWNAGIFIFLVILGIMVALINVSGATVAFGKWAAKHIKGRVGTQIATFILGCLLFIDDYFNCLTVGAVMTPVSDGAKISRAKLAYIIDATAAPVCAIAPISSWAAAVAATASDMGTGISSIELFIQTIPFNFYALMSIVFIVGISVMGFDYGPMASSELAAYRDGIVGGNEGSDDAVENSKATVLDLVLPVVVLFIFCVIGMLYVGGMWEVGGEYYMDLPGAFGNTDASVGLSWGSIITLVITYVYLLARGIVKFNQGNMARDFWTRLGLPKEKPLSSPVTEGKGGERACRRRESPTRRTRRTSSPNA